MTDALHAVARQGAINTWTRPKLGSTSDSTAGRPTSAEEGVRIGESSDHAKATGGAAASAETEPVFFIDEPEEATTEDDERRAPGKTATVAELNRPAPTLRSFVPEFQKADRVRTLQEWEGTVTALSGTSFVARLRDRTDPEHVEEHAEFEIEQVPDDDLELVVPGAVFYWTVGYRIASHGQKTLFSEIRFRRLPAWSVHEIRRIESAPSDFDEFFDEARDDMGDASAS